MGLWIELNTGEFLNLNAVWNIYKSEKHKNGFISYDVIYAVSGDTVSEEFHSEEDRDKRLEGIKAMLIESSRETYAESNRESNAEKTAVTTPPMTLGEYIEKQRELQLLEFGEIAIEEIDLSPRSFNRLLCANIKTVADVALHTRKELLKIRGLGVKSIEEIEMVLREKYGVYLKCD